MGGAGAMPKTKARRKSERGSAGYTQISRSSAPLSRDTTKIGQTAAQRASMPSGPTPMSLVMAAMVTLGCWGMAISDLEFRTPFSGYNKNWTNRCSACVDAVGSHSYESGDGGNGHAGLLGNGDFVCVFFSGPQPLPVWWHGCADGPDVGSQLRSALTQTIATTLNNARSFYCSRPLPGVNIPRGLYGYKPGYGHPFTESRS